MLKVIFYFLLILYYSNPAFGQSNRWKINENGSISWLIHDRLPHKDHIETSGKYISAVIRYGVNADHSLFLQRDLVWPMLRTVPNNTHASLTRSFTLDPVKLIAVNKRLIQKEKVHEIVLDGKMIIHSTLDDQLKLQRILYPSTDIPVFCEKYILTNISAKDLKVEIPNLNVITQTIAEDGVDGSYTLSIKSDGFGSKILQPQTSTVFYVNYVGEKKGEHFEPVDHEKEFAKRGEFLDFLKQNLIFESPDTILNQAFAFAKIRASESIFETKGGPMHGPGGLSYYAAIWANDQAEYINPFFPYLGYEYGISSAINAYRHFARFINPDYNPIPSSIIAEGTDIWNGVGDRGDAAMIAYGASRFALSQGNKEIALELWPLIEWCLEFNRRKLNLSGVVASDSDELEGRFPAGNANLCTSSLYYDALISAAHLGKALNLPKKKIDVYFSNAQTLKNNIEKYFGYHMAGYDTYRYFAGNDTLRAWICIPLTVNILERKKGTIDALFSSELWTEDGLASQAGDKTFWDRSTLYALRGVISAGDTRRGLDYLKYYSRRRLLGDHVPYPVEAFPEGNQRHLSAESGLYCRIFTEGFFGIRPEGLNAFSVTPQLPEDWDFMRLKNVHGYGKKFDITIQKEAGKIRLTLISNTTVVFNTTVENGKAVSIHL
ncbi:MAG: hypothetical protein KA536_17375 [Saprospiraceae bacterium]|nr:hypothetical protein [Saprospiraceae bacterium]